MSEKICYNDNFSKKADKKNEVTIIEEFYNVPNSFEEEIENGLVRVEMNIIEFPIFSKDNKIKKNTIKKYYFSENKGNYLKITPAAQNSIPGEFEEKVFLTLMKIFKEQGRKQTFYCKASEILDILGYSNSMKRRNYGRLKSAMEKLSMTSYSFSNLFYNNQEGKILESVLTTNLMNYWLLTLKDSSNEEKELFTDKRTREIYKITFSEEIYKNLATKGYLVFNYEELLSIKDPVTRAIYTQLTKWRNKKLVFETAAWYIARRIPLSWKSYSIKRTVLKIESSLEELKELGYISGFEKKIGRKIEETKFQIYFSEEHNKVKQNNFYLDRNGSNNDVYIHTVEESTVKEAELIEPHKEEQLNQILNIFGEKGKGLKTLPHAIKEVLKEHDFYYVKYAAEYAMIYSKQSLLKYFKDTLKENWHEEYMVKEIAKEKRKQKAKEREKEIEEAVVIEEPKPTFSKEEFEKLSQEAKQELEIRAYQFYLKNSGGVDNKIMRGIFERSKFGIMSKNFPELIAKFKAEINEEIEDLKQYEEITDVEAYLEEAINEAHAEKEKQLQAAGKNDWKEYDNIAVFTFEFYNELKKVHEDIKLEDVGAMLKMFGEFGHKGSTASYDSEKNLGKYFIKRG